MIFGAAGRFFGFQQVHMTAPEMTILVPTSWPAEMPAIRGRRSCEGTAGLFFKVRPGRSAARRLV